MKWPSSRRTHLWWEAQKATHKYLWSPKTKLSSKTVRRTPKRTSASLEPLKISTTMNISTMWWRREQRPIMKLWIICSRSSTVTMLSSMIQMSIQMPAQLHIGSHSDWPLWLTINRILIQKPKTTTVTVSDWKKEILRIKALMTFQSTRQMTLIRTRTVNLWPRYRSKLRSKINGRNVRWKPWKKLKLLPKRKVRSKKSKLMLRKKIKIWIWKKSRVTPKRNPRSQKKTLRKKSKKLLSSNKRVNNKSLQILKFQRNPRRKRKKINRRRRWIAPLWPTLPPET